jgi:signal transduction histidine kinase/CheY-like chemotaxis protein
MTLGDDTEDLEDLYENAPCGYLSVSPDGLIAKANQTFTTWAGCSRAELIGSRFHDWLPIAGRIYYETHLLPLLRMQGFVSEVALDFAFGDDARLPTLVNLVERRDPAGDLRYIRMTIFNATDRRRYEKELLAARAVAQAAAEEIRALNDTLRVRITELEKARAQTEELLRQSQKMEAIGQLTGGIAHDFNNLLAGITGSLEMLDRRIEQGRIENLTRYVSAARGATKRAATLAHRLLAFSRRQQLEPQPTDVNRVVSDLEDMVRRSVGAAIQLEVIGAGGLWTTVVDRNQLENAVLNLCINARDAMPAGGRLTIETSNKWLDNRVAVERDMDPGQYVALCVTDTGTGMTSEILARACDPFFTTKPPGLGTGLGLTMVHAFARQAGGQVRIYTEIGKGTTICIYLPRHRGPPADMESLASTTGAWQALHAETILIVDDEPTVRMIVGEAMTDVGYQIVEAADGPTALKLLQTSARFDLLITDLGLPGGLTGQQLANAARAAREDLKVLFITGYAENAAVENGHLVPGCRMLTKPFSIEALTQAVSSLLPE